MLFLTMEQHLEVFNRLRNLSKERSNNIPYHSAGIEYTSLMVCFLLHQMSVTETILRLVDSFGQKWFPVTSGFTLVRSMFETDVTAHYITQAPAERAHQYIEFGHVLNKQHMDACLKHQGSKDSQWREAMALMWDSHWASQEHEVNEKFNMVAQKFTHTDRNGKRRAFQNWSGMTLRRMAQEVDHLEAYDIFYAELSSFTHIDVHLADRFLKRRADGPFWSQRAEEGDVGNVIRHAATFMTCFLELFGRQFKTWSDSDVQNCWKVESTLKGGT